MNNVVIYQNDHLGTPQKLTAVNGAVVWSAKYSSFGEANVDAPSTVNNNLRFPGQYFDQETGLHYNWHRYYDPLVGRYISKDIIGIKDGVNQFNYSSNNSIKYFDPFGLFVYNKPEPKTGRLKGDALELANCMEKCMKKNIGSDFTTFYVSGGSECTPDGRHVVGGVKNSKHCTDQAFDMWFKTPNGKCIDREKTFNCALECGAKFALIEQGGKVWHFQTVRGRGESSGDLPMPIDPFEIPKEYSKNYTPKTKTSMKYKTIDYYTRISYWKSNI